MFRSTESEDIEDILPVSAPVRVKSVPKCSDEYDWDGEEGYDFLDRFKDRSFLRWM